VFDRDWRLVAVHQAGGELREPGTGRRVHRSQGIRASVVAAGLEAAGLEFE
jgi:hypothetical protein